MGKLELKGLTKKFGNITALEDVSFKVEDGEFCVVLGPSGSGKTTLLRCIAGLENPDFGEIFIDDHNVTMLPPGERDVSMVFQSFSLFDHMSVYDNIGFPLMIRGAKPEQIKSAVYEAAELLGISELLGKKPNQLSGGEQQRVAIARAIIRKPRIILMDEPLSNIDTPLRIQMRTELKRVQREAKVTTIYVTHDQIEAMSLADKIAVINKGRLMQFDTPMNLYNRPSNFFVAVFIGTHTPTVLEGKVIEKDARLFFQCADLSIELREQKRELLNAGDIYFVVRADDLSISRSKSINSFQGRIDLVEHLGQHTALTIRVNSSYFNALIDSSFEPKVNETVWLSINKYFLFLKKSGELL